MIKKGLVGLGALFALLVVLFVLLALFAPSLMRRWSTPKDLVRAKSNGQAMAKITGRTVVAVVGHPDDAEWYSGGALGLLKQRGNRVVVMVGTSGEQGGNSPDLAQIRETEQLKAAKILGYDRVVFARNPDRGLKNEGRFREQVRRLFEEEKPDVLITFDSQDPAFGYRHSDHLAAGEASLEVAKDFPSLRSAYLFSAANPDVLLEIAPMVTKKGEARAAHESQNGSGRRGASGLFVRALFGLLRAAPSRQARSNMNAGSAGEYGDVGIRYGEPYRLLKLH